MYNEHLFSTPGLLLVSGILPDGQSMFDNTWKLSPVGAICGVVAIVAGLFAWLQWKELKAERKTHRADCATKDAELARVNKLFQEEMAAGREVLQGVIHKLETHSEHIDNIDIREEFQDAIRDVKNGLRGIGEHFGITSDKMRMD